MKKSKLAPRIAAGLGAAGLITAVTGAVSYRMSLVSNRNKAPDRDSKRILRAEVRKKNNAFLFDHKPEDIEIITPDALRLRAWFVPSETPSKRFAICVHGHNCNGPDECGHLFPFYHYDMNCNYLLPDLRGHGRSDGNLIGFGSWDSKDIKLWADYLVERFGEDIVIILHGISMGAATVMLVNNTSPREQIKVIIEDCGYTDAKEEVDEVIKLMGFRHIYKPLGSLTNLFCRTFSKYDLRKDASPLATMKNAKNPVLFVHGDEDKLVPFEMCGRLYDACPVEKDIFTVEGAEHAYCYYDAREEYNARVKAFVEKYI